MTILNVWTAHDHIVVGSDSLAETNGGELGQAVKFMLVPGHPSVLAGAGLAMVHALLAMRVTLQPTANFDTLTEALPGYLHGTRTAALAGASQAGASPAQLAMRQVTMLAGWSPRRARFCALLFKQDSLTDVEALEVEELGADGPEDFAHPWWPDSQGDFPDALNERDRLSIMRRQSAEIARRSGTSASGGKFALIHLSRQLVEVRLRAAE